MIGFKQQAYRAVVRKIPEIERARSYAETGGAPDQVAETSELARMIAAAMGEEEQEHSLNFPRLIINSYCNRLEVAAIVGETDKQTELINSVWDESLLGIAMSECFFDSLRDGDGYMGVYLTDDEEVILVEEDAASIHIERDAIGQKLWAAKTFEEVVGYSNEGKAILHTRLTIWSNETDTVERWVSREYSSVGKQRPTDENDWLPYSEDGSGDNVEDLLYGIPLVHFRTVLRGPGRPVHKDAYSVANTINKLSSQLQVSVDFAGFPQRWALSEDANQNVFSEDPLAAASRDPEAAPRLKSGPGMIHWLRNVKAVGSWSSAAPASYLDPLSAYVKYLGILTGVPMHLLDANGVALSSGESQRAAEASLRKGCERYQRLFGSAVSELFELVLDMLGVPGRVECVWAPSASYDDSDAWANVAAQVAVGVPLEAALMSIGISAELASQWADEHDAAQNKAWARQAAMQQLAAQQQPGQDQPSGGPPPGNSVGG